MNRVFWKGPECEASCGDLRQKKTHAPRSREWEWRTVYVGELKDLCARKNGKNLGDKSILGREQSVPAAITWLRKKTAELYW